jgi:hypothetical protein
MRTDAFERSMAWAVAAGAVAGLMRYVLTLVGLAPSLWLAAAVALCLVCARGDRTDRWLLRGLGALGACACAALPPSVAEPCGCAVVGAVLVWSVRCDRGRRGVLDTVQLGPRNGVVGAALGAGLGWMGLTVAGELAARALALGVSPAVAHVAAGAMVALFLGLSAAAAYVVLRPDPVEARAAQVFPGLTGDLGPLARRALRAYRDCARALRGLPLQPEREELAVTVARLTQQALGVCEEWASLGREARPPDACAEDSRALEDAAARATDEVARGHYALAMATAREEEQERVELGRRRERLVARLWSHVSLMERTRTALASARSGHADVRAAELSGLARRMNALGDGQRLDGELAHQAATSSTLAELET